MTSRVRGPHEDLARRGALDHLGHGPRGRGGRSLYRGRLSHVHVRTRHVIRESAPLVVRIGVSGVRGRRAAAAAGGRRRRRPGRAAPLYPAAERAAQRATTSPTGLQAAYDAARDLQEALRAAAPLSPRCAPLRAALDRYAAGRVLRDGGHRPAEPGRPRRRARGPRSGARRRSWPRRAGRCAGGAAVPPSPPLAMSPAPGEAFFGPVVARAPEGGDAAELTVDGGFARDGRGAAAAGCASGSPWRRARTTCASRSRPARGSRRVLSADGAVLLPESALRRAPSPPARTPRWRAASRGALAGGPRYRAAWVHDLADGRSAGVGADLRFPAASTVKLGLMAAVLARLGARARALGVGVRPARHGGLVEQPGHQPPAARFGGAGAAQEGLRRLGARGEHVPRRVHRGDGQVGAARWCRAGSPPPATSAGCCCRCTRPPPAARRRARPRASPSTRRGWRSGGWRRRSSAGDNASLLRGGRRPRAPSIAQKNGWIRAARLAAGDRLPAAGARRSSRVATYDDGRRVAGAAQAQGARVAALVR